MRESAAIAEFAPQRLPLCSSRLPANQANFQPEISDA
jgi:hypothetical protein